MTQYENREYYIDDPEMPKLFMQSWAIPQAEYRGCILITHGISEHSECYQNLAHALCDQGWYVYAWDLPGHGQSDGKRGYIKDFNQYSRDLKSVIKKLKEDETKSTSNFHLIGHSMGGLITLQTLLADDRPRVQSAILSNPALGLAIPVPKVKELASQWLNQLWPSLTLHNEVRLDYLSRDPNMMDIYTKDPLRHDKVSAPLYLGMLETMESVKSNIKKLDTPTLWQISGMDKVINPQTSLDFYKRIPGPKNLKLYENSYHEVYNDLNKQEAIDDLIQYLGEYPL